MTPLTLSLRQRKLVHYLQFQSAYTTGQELASQLQVSARTIRNDIAEINQILNGTGIRIASKRSEGYLLVSSNQDQLKELSRTSSSFLSSAIRVPSFLWGHNLTIVQERFRNQAGLHLEIAVTENSLFPVTHNFHATIHRKRINCLCRGRRKRKAKITISCAIDSGNRHPVSIQRTDFPAHPRLSERSTGHGAQGAFSSFDTA